MQLRAPRPEWSPAIHLVPPCLEVSELTTKMRADFCIITSVAVIALWSIPHDQSGIGFQIRLKDNMWSGWRLSDPYQNFTRTYHRKYCRKRQPVKMNHVLLLRNFHYTTLLGMMAQVICLFVVFKAFLSWQQVPSCQLFCWHVVSLWRTVQWDFLLG